MAEREDNRLDFARRRLEALRRRHLHRHVSPIANGVDPWIEIDGRRLLNLSSNNYLGLAMHPDVTAAAATAAQALGCGTGASRLISGTSELHQRLETRLARFKNAESALLFNSGYTANTGVIPALVGPGDLVLGDELNHASLIDGCRLSRAEFHTYAHRDAGALEEQLSRAAHEGRGKRRLVVTDSVFSMDGDLAPLTEIAALCRSYDALLLVDEAHATGCLGPAGRGLVAHLGLEEDVTVTMSTLSKAFGGFGAFVTGGSLLIEYLVNVCRGFIFTTALPPTVVAASLAALDALEREPEMVERLQANGDRLRCGLQKLGFDTLGSETHIVPVLVGSSDRAMEMAANLRQAGVFAVPIRPPTVPMGAARIRVSVMATHTLSDLEFAIAAFENVGKQIGIFA
ncbi:8-amino-7-oxononanoate synthase [Nitrolancea hollandica]|uniref:8-amino-7-ketopelargonate synthase n=1 Tax=Nitrolancea hollandica Lb TaxID=1129897 RepID=I4EH97_9BACT|nr:8-amino-7-oxononanoate synthase [Nitrolancea hollandica]CCF84059.1 8-amino-7-oxononanoate synthase [Nitrolancea hollandica Lb]